MSELNELPVSEGFLLSAGAMLVGMIGGCLTCILRSRCSSIKCCGIELTREVIPPSELNTVNIATSTQ